jgi:hypothetical protein
MVDRPAFNIRPCRCRRELPQDLIAKLSRGATSVAAFVELRDNDLSLAKTNSNVELLMQGSVLG